MTSPTHRRVHDLLQAMPTRGLDAAKRLFLTELNYDRAGETLSCRQWPQRVQDTLAEPPRLLAQHASAYGSFDVIYAKLAPEQRGRHSPLSLTAERLVVDQLLRHHSYALFLFSDADERHWHLLNVKLDRAQTEGEEQPSTATRRVFRRIAVGPHERLRTASERVAMLDLASLSPDLSGLSPLAIQQRHDEAFDVEAVTKEFFQRFARLFYAVRDEIANTSNLASDPDDAAQLLLDRLLFLYFIQKKGWLDQDPDYLYNRFCDGYVDRLQETDYYTQIVYPLFLALSNPLSHQGLEAKVGQVPFLNGGLFELSLDKAGGDTEQSRLAITNATFEQLFDHLLEHYNFTITEDSPLDQEVAVDPEMLGKIFESVVLEREQDPGVDLRKATGSYYTPRPVVAFMCREALAEYLAGESGIERERVSALFDLPPAGQLTDRERVELTGLLTPIEAKGLRSLLLEVRACDPAVGSGAFLVGLLQAITGAVALLDWRLRGDTALARRNYLYDLKKEVIERCLYGVDVQAQAVKLCELRLWLSLIVDYELPEDQPFGQAIDQVPALPNLSYNVRQGDSLLERLFGQVVQLDALSHDRETQELIEDLQREKAAYFSLAETPEKRRRELHILDLQVALAEKLVQAQKELLGGRQASFFEEETAAERKEREAWEARLRAYEELAQQVARARAKVAGWKRRDTTGGKSLEEMRRLALGGDGHPTFLWRIDFAEVFQEKGGFDVMIANPPYIRQEKITHLKEALKPTYPRVYHGVADIYVYFYSRGLDLLHEGGVLVYISSNKFMRAGYGKKLRQLLGRAATLDTVVDFGDLPVFEATTYPTVLVIRKQPPREGHAFRALTVDDIGVVSRVAEAVGEEAWPQEQASLRPEGWTLTQPEVLALMDKLRRRGTPLEEYIEGKFYRGLTTGLNKAFVIDQATRDRLVAEDPRSAEVIKPWLRGRDVKRWRVEWSGLYVVFTRRGIEIDQYPAVKQYLTQFKKRLTPGIQGGRKPGNYEWYEIQDTIDYYEEFEKPKIVYPDIAKGPEFAYDTSGAFGGNTMYILPTSEMHLLGILNSSTVAFFYTHISASIQSDYLRFIATYMEQVPIAAVNPDQRIAIEVLVHQLLDANGQGPHVAEWERQLNALVYEAYGLTEEEIAIIERGV